VRQETAALRKFNPAYVSCGSTSGRDNRGGISTDVRFASNTDLKFNAPL